MLRNAINQNEVNIFFGGGDLYFYMGKIGVMVFALVNKGRFDLSLALAAELCRGDPFPVEKQFALCDKADHITAPRSMAEKVTSLTEVKFVTWYPFS